MQLRTTLTYAIGSKRLLRYRGSGSSGRWQVKDHVDDLRPGAQTRSRRRLQAEVFVYGTIALRIPDRIDGHLCERVARNGGHRYRHHYRTHLLVGHTTVDESVHLIAAAQERQFHVTERHAEF